MTESDEMEIREMEETLGREIARLPPFVVARSSESRADVERQVRESIARQQSAKPGDVTLVAPRWSDDETFTCDGFRIARRKS